jgi:uncharacterized protein
MNGSSDRIEMYADEGMLKTLSRHCCVGCGACCRWPSQVFLYADDIKRIAGRLGTEVDEFLLRWCVIVWWKWDTYLQFRIALARRAAGNECVFLKGSLCSIHEFKPLLCKAGPAAWGWIRNSEYFWYFVRESPSFRHPAGTFSGTDANHWFVTTRIAEAVASQATSVQELALVSDVSQEVLQRLDLVEFKEEVFNVRRASTTPPDSLVRS